MKKLKLNSTGFDKAEPLTRSQLKSITGGTTPEGSYTLQCYCKCTYYLNEQIQTVAAWGGSCTSSAECESTPTTCSSFGGDGTWASYCYCAVRY